MTTSTPGPETSSPQSIRDRRYRVLFPKPSEIDIVIAGCGAIGRQVAIQLAVIGGWRSMTLYDHDQVEEVNTGAQGFSPREIGTRKVFATRALLEELNPALEIFSVDEKLSRKIPLRGGKATALFMCVDTMTSRKLISRAAWDTVQFIADARMAGKMLRWLAGFRPREWSEYYEASLFQDDEAFEGACTSRTSFHMASLAASFVVEEFSQWLMTSAAGRLGDLPPGVDYLYNAVARSIEETNA